MPFDRAFDEAYVAIKQAAESCGLTCTRADEDSRSGQVLQIILETIKESHVIVADLTGGNPNVFYETAFAHAEKTPQKVILIAQRDVDVPFDLRALRYLQYDNNLDGRMQLQNRLLGFITEALDDSPGEYVDTISKSLERSRRLVADCQALLASGVPVVERLIIRTYSGFSSLSIADGESGDSEGLAERELLLQERNLMRKLIQGGATYKAVLSPLTEKQMLDSPQFAYRRLRWERLKEILQGNTGDIEDKCLLLDRVQFVVSPLRNNHVVILGDRLLYEGVKTKIEGGFGLTLRITHRGIISAFIKAFDSFFADAAKYTVAQTPRASGESEGDWKRRAVLDHIDFKVNV